MTGVAGTADDDQRSYSMLRRKFLLMYARFDRFSAVNGRNGRPRSVVTEMNWFAVNIILFNAVMYVAVKNV